MLRGAGNYLKISCLQNFNSLLHDVSFFDTVKLPKIDIFWKKRVEYEIFRVNKYTYFINILSLSKNKAKIGL